MRNPGGSELTRRAPRAARRGRSRKEFAAKICIVVEEADETEHWLGMIQDCDLMARERVEPLRREADELMRLFAATRRTLRSPKDSWILDC